MMSDGLTVTGFWGKTRTTLEMIKWEHSIFALPFALTATILAANGLPAVRTVIWILVAMVAARSCAMAFNRWADAELDAANPRTKSRAIPAGLLSREFVLGFTVLAGFVFVLAAAALNRPEAGNCQVLVVLGRAVKPTVVGQVHEKIDRWTCR